MVAYREYQKKIDNFFLGEGFSITNEDKKGIVIYKEKLTNGIDIGIVLQWDPNKYFPRKDIKWCARITVNRKVDKQIAGETILPISESLTNLLIKMKIIPGNRSSLWIIQGQDDSRSEVPLLLRVLKEKVIPYLEDPSSKPLDYIDAIEEEGLKTFFRKLGSKLADRGYIGSSEGPKYQFVKQHGNYYLIVYINVNHNKFTFQMARNIIPNILIKEYYLQYREIHICNDMDDPNEDLWDVEEDAINRMMDKLDEKEEIINPSSTMKCNT
jgi:hypothetical protein